MNASRSRCGLLAGPAARRMAVRSPRARSLRMVTPMLFDKVWAQIKGAEEAGTLTVEEALDCATRLPQALYCSMMECLVENGEDPAVVVAQVARLHDQILKRLRYMAHTLRVRLPREAH